MKPKTLPPLFYEGYVNGMNRWMENSYVDHASCRLDVHVELAFGFSQNVHAWVKTPTYKELIARTPDNELLGKTVVIRQDLTDPKTFDVVGFPEDFPD